MIRRAIVAAAIAVAIGGVLAGCQAATPGAFTQTAARADIATWTRQAVAAADGSGSVVKLSAFQACPSDSSPLPLTTEWRTITYVDVPATEQAAATRAIESALGMAHWKTSTSHGIAKLTGPDDQKRHGLITIQTAGSTQLAISVTSPCYS